MKRRPGFVAIFLIVATLGAGAQYVMNREAPKTEPPKTETARVEAPQSEPAPPYEVLLALVILILAAVAFRRSKKPRTPESE